MWVIAFSEALVKIVAGESCFPALGTLDSDRTDANHQAMVDLASQGILKAIVTTNVDTLIECAFAGLCFCIDHVGVGGRGRSIIRGPAP